MPHVLLRLLLACVLTALVAACDEAVLVPTRPELSVERSGYLPVIDSLEPENPAVGEEVTLHGTFRKLRKDDGLFVSFNGYDSQHVTQVNEATIKAVVPEGATSGNVVVVIGDSVAKGRFVKVRDKKSKD